MTDVMKSIGCQLAIVWSLRVLEGYSVWVHSVNIENVKAVK